MTYRVVWEIDIEADSQREAAETADAFRRLSSMPSFTVRDQAGEVTEVDLEEPNGERPRETGRRSVVRPFGRR